MSESQNMDEESALPDNCQYVEVGRKWITVPVDSDETWLDDPEFEDVEIEDHSARHTMGKVRFEEGDHIPLVVAEKVFEAYKDRLILKDGNHSEISRGKHVNVDNQNHYH